MKNIKVLLLYPPEQNWPETMCKPNGSLAYPMLAGALLKAGFEVDIYDACVGNGDDDLEGVFYKNTPLESGMLRTGVAEDRILDVVASYDVVGITSIFSHQETMVLRAAKIIKEAFPNKLLISGGVNARHRIKHFFDNGFDIICMSEAENTIVEIVRSLKRGDTEFDHIARIAFMRDEKVIYSKAVEDIFWNLDDLPMPAWHLLPNERYWKIGRPHGGHFLEGEELRYASMMTSLGCPFSCSFCHIASELKGSFSGPIGKFRIKSDERVLEEMGILSDLGVKQVFIEDDSLLGKKKRAIRLIKKIIGMGLDILDVNGINVIHLVKLDRSTKRFSPDYEVIETLAAAGFRDIALPFESGNARIIKKYASNKWSLPRVDVSALIKACNEHSIRVSGNFMIGFPDETEEEVYNTIEFAKKCMSDGLNAANFFLCMPLPGTPLFDTTIAMGMLPADFNPDLMHWQKANMINTAVPPQKLEEIRDRAWQDVNRPEFRNYKKAMIIDKNTGEIHKKGIIEK